MALLWIIEIEGICNASGDRLRYCTKPPNYSDATYLQGLVAGPDPSGGGLNLKSRSSSTGGFQFILNPSVGPFNWRITTPRAVSGTLGAMTAGALSVLHALDNNQAGIGADEVWFIGGETIVTDNPVTGASAILPIAIRGAGGSLARTHSARTGIYASPPAMAGRRVWVWSVERDAASPSSENRELQGIIAGEGTQTSQYVYYSCDSVSLVASLNRKASPRRLTVHPFTNESNGVAGYQLRFEDESWTAPPRFSDAGANIWIPDLGRVLLARYDSENPPYWRHIGEPPRWQASADAPLTEFATYDAYEVANADPDGAFPAFGWTPPGGSFTVSGNVARALLNLALSIDETNYDAGYGNYDLGERFYPDHSMAWRHEDIDWPSWNVVADLLESLPARELWIGGARPYNWFSLAHKALAPIGVVPMFRLDGKISLVRVGQPSSTQWVLDEYTCGGWHEWKLLTESRAIDSVSVALEPGPDDSNEKPSRITVRELSGRELYPYPIGQVDEWSGAPYSSREAEPDGLLFALLSTIADLFSTGVAYLTGIKLGPNRPLDVGDSFSISHPNLFSSVTGLAGAEQWGLVTRVSSLRAIGGTRTAEALLFDPIRQGAYGPVLILDGIQAFNDTTMDVVPTGHTDQSHPLLDLEVGDILAVYDRYGKRAGGPYVVVSITIPFDQFRISPHLTSATNAGDWFGYASYAECTESQRDKVAFAGDGGEPSGPVNVDGDESYKYGP